MFIWLASYPKSGNTLVRALLSSYFFSNDGIFNFELIKNIKQFPNSDLFENLGVDVSNDDDVIKNYIKAQASINKKNTIQFLKTHSYLFNINNNPFTDLNNTLGAIYVVRDPRNVVTSYAHHETISVEDSFNRMINNVNYGGNINSNKASEKTKVYLGSWSGNFKSWKSFKQIGKYLLIKYENLINSKEETFEEILQFIHDLKGIKFEMNQSKFQNAIKTTSFENMKNKEEKEGFLESKINKNTGEKIPFFNLGKKNNWEKLLKPEMIKKIEKSFENEMRELGYL